MPLTRENALEISERMKIYAQPQRLMILACLAQGERTVGEIDAATQVGQPALSQQLGELRRAKIVSTRRAAKQVYYRIANDKVLLCIRCIEAIFGENDAPSALKRALAGVDSLQARKADGAAAFARLL
ncbi:MAG: metalloregulator ArsR/SmtB family transcription factor [Methylocystis sp.]|nr:metalloregulator ArsR/SmtB family transcription factor [Methylocystis sp.]